MFDIFERIDAAKEHHERLLAEAAQNRRFPGRGANRVRYVALIHRILIALGNLLIALGMKLKAALPASGDNPTNEAIGSSRMVH